MKRFYINIILLCLFISHFSILAERQTGQISGLVAFEISSKKILIFKLQNNIAENCNNTGRLANRMQTLS